MKRALDFSAALAALTVLALPLGLIAFAVWIEDGDSPFYRGLRVGKGRRPFRMVKFRSMRRDAWKTGVNSTAAGDPRITCTGRFLRRFKLDEFPQLLNVLTGEMSLAGPRPQVPEDASLYTEEERRLFAVRPGLTDLASIVFADEAEILAGSPDPDLLYNQIIRPWKSRLALAYLDRVSLALDLRVILLTVLSAVSRRRALNGVARLLASWNAEPLLIRAALREAPLLEFPPPGATEVVSRYSRQTHA
jgi:lipopolysaccharide/colanic/teichoic acid biosynthesis glycosyltransferase